VALFSWLWPKTRTWDQPAQAGVGPRFVHEEHAQELAQSMRRNGCFSSAPGPATVFGAT